MVRPVHGHREAPRPLRAGTSPGHDCRAVGVRNGHDGRGIQGWVDSCRLGTLPVVPDADAAERAHGSIVALALGALGIVYGDIGTSPLYAFRESFEHADLDVTRANAYGVASIVFWALVVIISIKYLTLVMRADNHGEGGILALTALLLPTKGMPTGAKRAIIALGVFGTALLYGDGLITPA